MAGNPKFTVLFEKLRGKTFELTEDVMSIGRRDGMDICIKDSSLSGHHADIIRSERDGKYFFTLRDNDSTNGTKINGVPITEQELKNSDLILFGAVEVLFDGSDNNVEAGNYSPTITLDIENLESSSTVPNVINLNPLAEIEAKKHARTQKLMLGMLILAGLILVGVAGYAIFSVFAEGPR